MTKKDKNDILQYVKTAFTDVEENLVNGELITQITSFGLESRKVFTLFINNELVEPFASYYEKCQKDISNAKECLNLNTFFGQKSLSETTGAIGETELEAEVDELNKKGIVTVQEYIDSLAFTNRRLESGHIKNTLLIYEGLTSLAFEKKEENKLVLIKK